MKKNDYSDLRGGVERYVAPSLDVLDVSVEKGFQISPVDTINYGTEGDAGGDPTENDYGSF